MGQIGNLNIAKNASNHSLTEQLVSVKCNTMLCKDITVPLNL